MRKTVIIFIILLLFGGCSHFKQKAFSPVDGDKYIKVISWPTLLVENKGEVGDSIVYKKRVFDLPAIELTKDLIHEAQYDRRCSFLLTIPSGILVLSGKNYSGDGIFYESEEFLTTTYQYKANNSDPGYFDPIYGGIFIYDDPVKAPEVYWYWPGERYNYFYDSHPEVTTKKTNKHTQDLKGFGPLDTQDIEGFGHLKQGFKRELIYTGLSGNSISILYNEFKDDMIRPAFSQQLTYDLTQGNEIGFQGARFQIIEANNISIRYKVIKNFD